MSDAIWLDNDASSSMPYCSQGMAAEVHKSSRRAGLRAELHERYTSYLMYLIRYTGLSTVSSQEAVRRQAV